MLELDPRIKDRSVIKTLLDVDKTFVGKAGYFAYRLHELTDLNKCYHGKITDVDELNKTDDYCFKFNCYGTPAKSMYFIADEDLLPPAEKYAQFRTIDQFLEYFTIGDIIKFRRKGYTYNYEKSMLTGVKFIDCCCYAYIANDIYTFTELFNDYELYLDDTIGWIPFGVKVHG